MPEGLAYEGTWKAGEINGEGQLSQKNGDIYTGTPMLRKAKKRFNLLVQC